MKDLTQGDTNKNAFSNGIRCATGLVILAIVSTGVASGINKTSVKNEDMWDTQIHRMEALANWQEDRGNEHAALELRERLDSCIYRKERCPEPNEFESITQLTLQNEDGSEEEYIALQ